MSHAMSIYLKPKGKEEYIYLFYYGGNSNVYQQFRENGLDCYEGTGEDSNYKELTKGDLNYILNDLNRDIIRIKKQLSIKEKYANGNSEIIDDIISSQDYIDELEEAKIDIKFLLDLVEMMSCDDNKLYHNSY